MWRSYHKSHSELYKAIRINDIVFSADKSSYTLYLRSQICTIRKCIICQQKVVPCKFVLIRISQGASMSDPLFVDSIV